MFTPYNYLDKNSGGTLGVQEKKGLPIGLGSAFAAIPPAPLPLDQRPPDTRYAWDPARFHALHPPTHSLNHISPTLDLSPIPGRLGTGHLGLQQGELTAPHPTYRIPHYMEHLYQSLHTPPQSSLRGLSPLERSSLALSNDYLSMSGLAATRLSDPLMLPASLTSTDLAFSIDGSRLASPRPSIRQSRKRALSSSPYSDSFDINSMIRFSPNSLVSIMNGSRSSSASGSYGHLSAGAISPALGVPPSMGAAQNQLQQLQAHIMRGASIPGSPFLAPSPLLQHSPSLIPSHQNIFTLTSQPQTLQHPHPIKPLCDKKDHNPLTDENKKEASVIATTASVVTRNPTTQDPSAVPEDDNMKEEPDDFIETNCNWKDCGKEFNTQDELVKHINNDHIHANKKSFVCRWKDCSRDEKPFKAQYMLVVHMRRHTGEKPHRCTFEGCFKAYSRLENLKTHLRSHTGEKPYMCEYPGCTKAFSNASDRAKHQNRTHSNEKPYVCKAPGCTKRYTDPSSLRKHVKTVHGADFYASKKHKGNDHQNNTGNGGNAPSKDGAADGSPRSDAGKGGSLSSPSVKSEQDPTSPGQNQSPPIVVAPVPMDQSRLFDAPISDTNISTTYDVPLGDDWDPTEEDLEGDLAIGVGSINGNVLTSTGTIHERNLRNRLKVRLQTKGLTNILPNIPGSRKSGTMGELSQKINQMKVNGATQIKSALDYPKATQTLTNNRRDSNSTVSTYYGSMKSDSSHPISRRGSEMSQLSCNSMGRPMASSLYDPISIGSSRRSSEVSNYMSNSPSTMASQLTAQLNRHAMGTPECYNTANLVLQTQNMSLSQDNLQAPQWSNGLPANPVGDHNSSGYFGNAGPLGPPTTAQIRDGTRRSSDPGRSIDRGLNDPSQRMQRYNSYYNCNYRGQFGMRPLMTPPIYNPALQNNQVGADFDNKIILPDDMLNYLNQQNGEIKVENKERTTTPNSMYNQPHINAMYPMQNMNPYTNQNMTSYPMVPHNGYQYPQTGYPTGQAFNQPMPSPGQTQQFNGQNPTYNQYPKGNINSYSMQNSNHNHYNGYNNGRPFVQNSFNMGQPRPQNGIPNYGLGSVNYGPVHVCGHLAAPNLPASAYQAPCSGCQSRIYPTYDNSGYQQCPDWNTNSSYVGQYDNNNTHMTYDPMSFNPEGMTYHNGIRDVQCQDVSQSTQTRLADARKAQESNGIPSPKKQTNPETVPEQKVPAEENKDSTTVPEDKENGYMKPDTYKRTLEYVQQCQTWSSSPVKEEVSSTTDQKPKLNSNGGIMVYPTVPPMAPMVPQEPVGDNPLTGAGFLPTFNSPLPVQVPNMVVNDMSSSLTSLQKENKYLQLLQ